MNITNRIKPLLLYEALTATVMSLFINLCSIIRSDYAQEQKKLRPKADKKLLRMIRKKDTGLEFKLMNQ